MEFLSSVVSKKLDLVNKLYQRSILPSVLEVAHDKRLASPIVVDLDPTTFCDLSCPECISKNILNDTQFTKDRLEQLAEEFAASSVKAVILIGGGEPLMHKSTGTVIRTLANAGVHVGIVTNGTLIHRYLDEIAKYVSWTRVSVDAATEETHNTFRPSGRSTSVFPTVVQNMRSLAQVKRGKLGYSFLLMYRQAPSGEILASNYHELLAAGKLAKEIGCDYIEVKAVFDEGHFIMHTPEVLLNLARGQVEALKELEDEGFRVLYSSTFTSLIERSNRVQAKEYDRCLTAQLRTTVTPTGVYVCPYHRGNLGARIGDISNQSFQSMWSVANASIINPRLDCNFHCARHRTNLEIAKLTQTGVHAEDIVDDFDLFI